MAPKKLTEYERKRLENIKRNEEMLAALKVHSTASILSAAAPARRPWTKQEAPSVLRQSQRTRGIQPDSKGLADDFDDKQVKPPRTMVLGSVRMSDAFSGNGMDSNRKFIDTILSNSKKSSEWSFCKYDGVRNVKCDNWSDYGEVDSCSLDKDIVESECLDNCVDIYSLRLKPENIARIFSGRIMLSTFFPCTDMKMIAAGNGFGDISFWNVNFKDEDDDGIYLYHPHSGSISGIMVQQPTMSKVLTSCSDGFIRLMDVNKESFDLVHSSDESVFSLSQQPNDCTSFCFGEGHGGMNIWDLRAGKSSTKYMLHECRINTIDFDPRNPNIMVTSSTDGTACIWDLRRMNTTSEPNALSRVNHQKPVHAAYFSPSGSYLATTSHNNTVRVLGGTNFDYLSTVCHGNHTGSYPQLRAIWGWDDSYIFIGNVKRRIDVISATQKRMPMTLKSEHMSAIPCRFSAHPYEVGTLAGATTYGQIYIWTLS